MIDFQSLIELLGDTFFQGDTTLAGVAIFTLLLMVVLALTKKAFVTLIVSLPLTFIFSQMGILPTDLMILLIIVAVLGLAYTSRNVWKD